MLSFQEKWRHTYILLLNCQQAVGCLLTGQLSSDSLERQLSELFNQRSQLGATDQLVFAVVQLVHRHQPIGQNSFY